MKVGMPTMAVTGVGKDMVRDQRYFSLATRIAAEMGAQIIKTYYVDKGFERIVAGCPVPIVIAGGKSYRSAKRLKCAGRLSIRALLVWIWGVIFSSLTIRWR